jgi:hypothetical protein
LSPESVLGAAATLRPRSPLVSLAYDGSPRHIRSQRRYFEGLHEVLAQDFVGVTVDIKLVLTAAGRIASDAICVNFLGPYRTLAV